MIKLLYLQNDYCAAAVASAIAAAVIQTYRNYMIILSAQYRYFILLLVAFLMPLSLRAENITFADANVKALCVANWNTDDDDELSMEEAAAVTSLGTVFREKNNIATFEELEYFTGLTSIDDYAFYKSSIRSIAFPATVTSIGKYAFSHSNICGEMHIPGTVKDIGDYAFDSCRELTSVVLEEGVETIGWHTFSGPIRKLSLPASITYIKSLAINPYVNGNNSSGISVPEGDLYVYANTTVPAAINDFAFYDIFAEGHLVVPFGCIEAYKAVEGWSHFGEYLEIGDVNGDGAINVVDVTTLIAYVTGQEPKSFKPAAADINGDGAINADDITQLAHTLILGGE